MSKFAKNCTSTVIPSLRYRNAPAAIDWLCRAFGFEKQAVYSGEDGSIAHAQLTFGNGMIMVSSLTNTTPYGKLTCQPDEIGKLETQAPCLVVADCDAIYQSAKAAGAEMIMDIEDKDYGGRAFACRDPEGHLWNVGSYDPWDEAS